jgi:cytochrome c-type biogenesis protein CcmH/NrfG
VDQAVAALRARVQAAPSDAQSWNLLARTYYQMQRWDDAINAAQHAVELAPYNAEYHLWLGRAYGLKAERSSWVTALSLARKTREEFERAVELNGANVDARSDLAEYYLDAPGFLGGGKDKAAAQADKMMPLDAGSAHWVRAAIAEKEKRLDVAESELKMAIQTGRRQAERWLDLAGFYRRHNRLNEMEQAVIKAVEVQPQERHPHVLYEAAETLYRAGRNFDGAVQLLRTYIAGNQSSEEAPMFQAHYLLGTILEKQGDRQGAAEHYRATLALAKDFAQAQAALRRVSSPLASKREP